MTAASAEGKGARTAVAGIDAGIVRSHRTAGTVGTARAEPPESRRQRRLPEEAR